MTRDHGPVQSMTGFAEVASAADGIGYAIEARSVNGRALDVKLRLPPGHERHEGELRRRVATVFRRGSITLALTLRRGETGTRFQVNAAQLAAYVDAIRPLTADGTVAPARADGLLALRGVIETAGDDEAAVPADALFASASAVLDALRRNRLEEGARLAAVIAMQLDEIDHLRQAVDAHPERALPAIRARLSRQIETLLPKESLDPGRLHQEAALLATRADVREELDRLDAHVAAARALLAGGDAVGRKLDFLAQEFNRETNTICSKAPHHAITALGLEMKAVVERFREQVQNLE